MSWYIEGGGNYVIDGNKVWGRHVILPSEEWESIKDRFKNRDAFATILMYDDKNQATANLYGPFYIDLDMDIQSEADYKKVKRDLLMSVTTLNNHYGIPMEYIRIYFSGSKGFHVIVPPEVFGIKPCKDLNEQYKAIMMDIRSITMFKTIDKSIYDRVRLFRLTNTINSNTGLYKVPIDIEFVRSSTYQDIIDYATQPREEHFTEAKFVREAARKFNEQLEKYNQDLNDLLKSKGKFSGKGEVLPCIKDMLRTPGIANVNRNKMTVTMASSLCQCGIEMEKALDMLYSWNTTYNSPALSQGEIDKTVKSAYQRVREGKTYGCSAIKELGMCVTGKCRIRDSKQ